MNINLEIGIRAKLYRLKNRYDQQHIADMLGVTRSQYANLEDGIATWKAPYIHILCMIFKCMHSDLFPEIVPIKTFCKLLFVGQATIKI